MGADMGIQKADEVVAQLVVDIGDKQKILDAVTHLQNTYPDLIVEREPTMTASFVSTRFCSASVNKLCEDVDIIVRKELMECNADYAVYIDIIEARPYTTMDGYKVYSTPATFEIGTANIEGFGVFPKDDWEDHMEQSEIALSARRKAREYIKRNPPISY